MNWLPASCGEGMVCGQLGLSYIRLHATPSSFAYVNTITQPTLSFVAPNSLISLIDNILRRNFGHAAAAGGQVAMQALGSPLETAWVAVVA